MWEAVEVCLSRPGSTISCTRAYEISLKQAKNTADGGERGTEALESTKSEPYHGPAAVRARAIWEISENTHGQRTPSLR